MLRKTKSDYSDSPSPTTTVYRKKTFTGIIIILVLPFGITIGD